MRVKPNSRSTTKAEAAPRESKSDATIKRRAIRKREPSKPTKSRTSKTGAKPAQPAPQLSAPPATATESAIAAHKFDVAPRGIAPRPVAVNESLGELPESYGTGRLYLAVRDPHWLYAYWDLGSHQMAQYRKQSANNQIVLQLFRSGQSQPDQEHVIHYDTRNWYLPVSQAGTAYRAILGYRKTDGSFHVISESSEARTPGDSVSADQSARFATIPLDLSFRELVSLVRDHSKEGEQLAETIQRLEEEGFPLPFQVELEMGPWSAEQARAMERIIGPDIFQRVQRGSIEVSEWLSRRLRDQMPLSPSSAGFSPAGASWSSAPGKGFWMAVNAELIIYGATEPNAKVTVDGKPILLRPDGTFSFHHVFPDGKFRIPIVAVSADGDDQRSAELRFQRQTTTSGEVGRVKQPGHLTSPPA
jgi:hypothetical protein